MLKLGFRVKETVWFQEETKKKQLNSECANTVKNAQLQFLFCDFTPTSSSHIRLQWHRHPTDNKKLCFAANSTALRFLAYWTEVFFFFLAN